MIRNGRPTFLSLGVAALLSFTVATATVYLFLAAGRGQLPAPILGQIFSPAGIGEVVEPPVIEPPRQAEEIADGTPIAGPFLVVGGSIGDEAANVNVLAGVDVAAPVPATTPFAAPADAFAPVPAGIPPAPAASGDRGAGDNATPPVVSSNDGSAAGDSGSGDNDSNSKKNKGKDHQNHGVKDSSKSKSPGGHGNGQAKGHDKHGKH